MFGGRRTKKELHDLKEEHQDLEERFEGLQKEHEKLQKEAGEETNVRISYIEEEIESMNQRVEKLANDSYEIKGEVRDIHESVLGMQTSLSEIVKLYKAIITQYGFGDMKAQAQRRVTKAPSKRSGDDPGDAIIRALEEEARGPRATGEGEDRRDRPKATTRTPSGRDASNPPPRPRPAPMSSNPLDELHRLSSVERDEQGLAQKVVARSHRGDKVTRVAKRDLERPGSSEIDREGEFTRSLPKKDVRSKEGARSAPAATDWESMEPPTGNGKRRPKPRLEDLLSPE